MLTFVTFCNLSKFKKYDSFSNKNASREQNQIAKPCLCYFKKQLREFNTTLTNSFLKNNKTGARNIALGNQSGSDNITGNDNIFIGHGGVNNFWKGSILFFVVRGFGVAFLT